MIPSDFIEEIKMSAFVVDKVHIDAILRAGLSMGRKLGYNPSWYKKKAETRIYLMDETASAVGQMLIDACVRSVGHRYGDSPLTDLPGPCDAYWVLPYEYKPNFAARIPSPVETLKLIYCYIYQSCEDPDFYESEAFDICEALRHSAIKSLQGYDEAPWEWTEEQDRLPARPGK